MSKDIRELAKGLVGSPTNNTALPSGGGFLGGKKQSSSNEPSSAPAINHSQVAAASEATPAAQTTPAPRRQQQVVPKGERMYDDLPAEAKKVYRDDVDPERYGVKPLQRNVRYYNKDIVKWLGDFSEENQLEGGEAITQSVLIETLLGIAMYDLQLQPDGFKSARDVRQYILSKLKE
ncbi:hypothetical protein GZH47_33340 (plasmid) [Paenibacillus rhizovicinus]|uniref:Uncharacterized protein n=1 Tax=Paenibacillus rhizovicinus TaxID=2704463 RepID=A0A6C0PB24_9BACL|nr:hypothetical protein [Paenibacillus rhizovicinus]QHW35780.1 hypothetical protein GZH47_33340 [Paenibacillus rhizovicinus]